MGNYSANNEFQTLLKPMGFEIYFFDDKENIGDKIKLIEQSKKADIDAIITSKNVVGIVGINKGENIQNIEHEFRKFFQKLDNVKKLNSLKLKIESKATERGTEHYKKVEGDFNEINKNIDKYKEKFNIYIKKIFFCPYASIDEDILRKHLLKGEYIIDKDIYEYFHEVSSRLNADISRNDLYHFLNIKMVDFEKKEHEGEDPELSRPISASRLSIQNKIIIYSLTPSVDNLIQYTSTLRVSQKYNKKGFQRMIKRQRLNKIVDSYLSKNFTFPNSIIIVLSPDVYKIEEDFFNKNTSKIRFYKEFNSLFVIDGQHRFFSFVVGDLLDRKILVTLIFFKNGSIDDKYLSMDRMFFEINKNQEKIDPNLSFILKARLDVNSREFLWYEIFNKLLKLNFFKDRFTFKESTLRSKESKKSIISVIQYGGVLSLSKTFSRGEISIDSISELYGTNSKTKLINSSFIFLKNYFEIVLEVLKSQSLSRKDLTPREIGALLRLLKHFFLSLKAEVKALSKNKNSVRDNFNGKNVQKVFNVLNSIDFNFIIGQKISASNWATVEGYMLKHINKNKKFRNFGNKVLLSKNGLEAYNSR